MRERDQNDAGLWHGHEAASAWASGFNHCAENHVDPLTAMLEQILAVPGAVAALEAAGGLATAARALVEDTKAA